MTSRLAGLTGATLETAPSVCQTCVWWQSRGNREPEKRKWIERAEEEWGAWGTVYRDDDGRVLGSMQYGPAALPARRRPARRAALRRRRARHVRVPAHRHAAVGRAVALPRRDRRGPRQGRARARGVRVPLPGGTSAAERFLVHRTVFPRDFLADFGFRTVRSAGRIELARLELGGLQPVEEGAREKVLTRGAGGLHAGARAGAAGRRLAVGARARRDAPTSSSAIWIALSAAPLRRLSQTRKSARPFSTVGSARTRPTSTSSMPTRRRGRAPLDPEAGRFAQDPLGVRGRERLSVSTQTAPRGRRRPGRERTSR